MARIISVVVCLACLLGVARGGVIVLQEASPLPVVADFTLPHGSEYNLFDGSPVFQISESFAGQSVIEVATFEQVSGTPSGPLALQAPVSYGVMVFDSHLQGLAGGNAASVDIGEGAISILFSDDVQEMGLTVAKGNGGTVTLAFFARDGAAVDSVQILNVLLSDYRFVSSDAASAFAGVTITNNDSSGIDIDNLRVPEPASLILLALGGLALVRRSRK